VFLLFTDCRPVCCNWQGNQFETVCNYRWDGYGIAGTGISQEASYCGCHAWKVVYSGSHPLNNTLSRIKLFVYVLT
jgi:hypothetical protein